MADADLKKQLGTLRYLHGLRAARQRMQAGAGQAGQPNPVPGQVSAAQGQQPEAAAGVCHSTINISCCRIQYHHPSHFNEQKQSAECCWGGVQGPVRRARCAQCARSLWDKSWQCCRVDTSSVSSATWPSLSVSRALSPWCLPPTHAFPCSQSFSLPLHDTVSFWDRMLPASGRLWVSKGQQTAHHMLMNATHALLMRCHPDLGQWCVVHVDVSHRQCGHNMGRSRLLLMLDKRYFVGCQ